MLSLPSSLILSILLLTTKSLSAPAPAPVADDGMWHPAGQAQASTWAATATTPTWQGSTISGAGVPYSQMTATAPGSQTTTPAVAPTALTSAASGTWQTAVTWPAGCELWANPCPPGAHVIGGATVTGATATGTASYENGFTSYTSMTDANGVITGMPPKATVAAGVTGHASNSTTLSTKTGSSGSSSTGSFSQPSASKIAASSNGAASLGAPLMLGAFAVAAALL
ncbi:hypothetical protein BLS_008245 [Venturia inaequalis]|uniref:Uncharacterized protein n=1 Tax=Venturia inaequalis TaxID=5025 RepID=A0A8H3Z2I2_VENIN|nr:hypothetical protein EG328_007103 [Venturia inaequalis]KAE9980813.1 hypothetical protein BLS_008245 [Venturia inaequalis]KAE9992612.1 hypothetical protein EG327_008355 [Venturia inaequalis]